MTFGIKKRFHCKSSGFNDAKDTSDHPTKKGVG